VKPVSPASELTRAAQRPPGNLLRARLLLPLAACLLLLTLVVNDYVQFPKSAIDIFGGAAG